MVYRSNQGGQMNQKTYEIEFITPCFCAGEDQTVAEVRAPSIRGQLRWWYRALGGFRVQTGSTKDAEAEIFGSISEKKIQKSKLVIRIINEELVKEKRTIDDFGWQSISSNCGYLLFNLRPTKDQRNSNKLPKKGVILPHPKSKVSIKLIWKGDSNYWKSIQALWNVFTTFGSLGSRSRRGFGSINSLSDLAKIDTAYLTRYFKNPENISIKKFDNYNPGNWEIALESLGQWLKEWRSRGRSGQNKREKDSYPGFNYAENDHDLGVEVLSSGKTNRKANRASIGLPIIQRYSKGKGTLNWDYTSGDGETGRFASPVILRIIKQGDDYIPLIIFVDIYQWGKTDHLKIKPKGKPVKVEVSLALYNEMKNDTELIPFLD